MPMPSISYKKVTMKLKCALLWDVIFCITFALVKQKTRA